MERKWKGNGKGVSQGQTSSVSVNRSSIFFHKKAECPSVLGNLKTSSGSQEPSRDSESNTAYRL